MPQANEYLSSRWDECSAWAQLAGNFLVSKGGIIYPTEETKEEGISVEDDEAIDYLCQEWDYGFEYNWGD
jgi:hypothetical protein